MNAKSRAPKGRYSREQSQEDRSEGQLKARLATLRWPCDRLGRDLGEDMLVRIYEDGEATPLDFFVQLKRAGNARSLARKESETLRCPLDVGDLQRWERLARLVVLMVWDAKAETGWWRPIPEIVKELDERDERWRQKKKVIANVPVANGTDDEGLGRLRWTVADHLLPLFVEGARVSALLLGVGIPPGGRKATIVKYDVIDALSKLTASSGGYFTVPDAHATGASDGLVAVLQSENNIEPVGPGVYHLAHFPRSEQEDLIALWLQTDRHGVLSHDTALFLHELSDIFPRQRHITVPPGWDPGDRDLGKNVVLHRGEVADDERRWIGPVPYTAPLRTVLDCIAAHLSPDLIEQAVEEGIVRGMFTAADLPPLVRRGAA